MKQRTLWWGLVVALTTLFGTATIMSWLSQPMEQPRDLSGGAISAMNVRCDEISDVHTTFEKLANAPEKSGMHNQLIQEWIKPATGRTSEEVTQQISTVRNALTKRYTDCAGLATPGQPTATSATSAPSVVSPSSSPSTSSSPAASPTSQPHVFVTWGQVAAHPPAGLKDIMSMTDIQTWSKARYQGNEVDARIVLVFGNSKMSDAAALKAAGVTSGKPPVMHVTDGSCNIEKSTISTPTGCPTSGVETILAPLQMSSSGEAERLVGGTGLFFDAKGVSLIKYQY